MKIWKHRFDSPIGVIELVSDDETLLRSVLPGEGASGYRESLASPSSENESAEGGEVNREAERQLKAYFDRRLKQFTLPFKIAGGSFREQVLGRVAQIGYGKTRTYGEIARELDKPGAARAVGRANGSNLLPIVIPCHRVVAVSGLGGYAAGLNMKRDLLELEGVLLPGGSQASLFGHGA